MSPRKTPTTNTRNGSVRKRGDAWEARWYAPDGSRRSTRRDAEGRPFRSANEAREFATTQQIAARRVRDGRAPDGTYLDRRDVRKVPTFKEVAIAWGETMPGSTTKTRVGYFSVRDHHLIPEFGRLPIAAITPTHLKRFRAKLEAQGRSANTIKNVMRVASLIFAMAMDDEHIGRNPASKLRLPKATEGRASILTPGQVEELIEATDEHYRPLVRFAAYSGARFGEITALRWKHVNREARTVMIESSVSEISLSEERRERWNLNNVGLIYGSTKNKRTRVIKVSGAVLDALGEPAGRTDLVFTTPGGAPIRPGNFRARVYTPAVSKAHDADPSIPTNFRFHDLRHTCASLLIAQRYNAKAIQADMGHSSISVTFDIYGHLMDDAFDGLPDVLDRVQADAQAERALQRLRAVS